MLGVCDLLLTEHRQEGEVSTGSTESIYVSTDDLEPTYVTARPSISEAGMTS